MNYYDTYYELPKKYLDYFNNFIDNNNDYYYLTDYEYDYCPKCLNKLDNLKCNRCNIDYSNGKDIYVSDDYDYNYNNYKYDISFVIPTCDYDNIIVYYVSFICLYDYEKGYDKKVVNTFRVYLLKDIINNLSTGEIYMYNEITPDKYINLDFIYMDNINLLKNNKYFKYIDMDKYKTFLNTSNVYELVNCFGYPIKYKEFEYLLKMELYNLARTDLSRVKFNNGNTFKERFGVPKKYYKIMKEMDINYSESKALRLYNTDNIDIIKFLSEYMNRIKLYDSEYLLNKPSNVLRLYNYIKDNDIEYYDYIDYLRFLKELKVSINNKIRFPKDFKEAHDKAYKEIIISKDNNINKKLINIHKYLKINTYEDDKYIIFPCYDIDSLLEESRNMNNCVRTYINSIIDHISEIYFMRDKNNINKSLITVEVRNGKVVQARRENNSSINKEDKIFLKKFEENYIGVEWK